MPRKFYTIFILPHAHARFRKIHLSRNFLFVTATLVLVAVAAAAFTPHLLLAIRSRSLALVSLQEENRKLRDQNRRFEASLAQLGAQLNAFEVGARRLAAAVGLREFPGLHPPAGGGSAGLRGAPVNPRMLEQEIKTMGSRADSLDESLEQIHRRWEERLRVLASTPSGMPLIGGFSDGYGWRNDPFTGAPEFHKGLDIVAHAGTLVRSTADGLVTRVDRENGYGRMAQISHGFGLGTLYGHMSEVLVKPGQRIRRGDPVGRVGSTGRSTGPHLHYEVFKGGRSVDPRPYLTDPRAR
jgi:murein DD-endopeptidase MepM/ murein hydrolase activator NlpD